MLRTSRREDVVRRRRRCPRRYEGGGSGNGSSRNTCRTTGDRCYEGGGSGNDSSGNTCRTTGDRCCAGGDTSGRTRRDTSCGARYDTSACSCFACARRGSCTESCSRTCCAYNSGATGSRSWRRPRTGMGKRIVKDLSLQRQSLLRNYESRFVHE